CDQQCPRAVFPHAMLAGGAVSFSLTASRRETEGAGPPRRALTWVCVGEPLRDGDDSSLYRQSLALSSYGKPYRLYCYMSIFKGPRRDWRILIRSTRGPKM